MEKLAEVKNALEDLKGKEMEIVKQAAMMTE